jgi:hypothetical protein
MKILKTLLTLSASLLLFGCLNKHLEGTYIGNDSAFFNQLTFKANNKVELIFMGATTEANYHLEDNKVKITSSGETQILNITKNGCLDGGGFIGIYCNEKIK